MRSVAGRISFEAHVLAEIVIGAARAFKLPAHTLAGPSAAEDLREEGAQQLPRLRSLFGAVAAGHGVVQKAVRHVGKYLHAIAAARVLERVAHAAHVVERDRMVALAEDEEGWR